MKYFGAIVIVGLIILAISPLAIYYWGLSRLDFLPIASTVELKTDIEQKIWGKFHEAEEPSLKKLTPYDIIFFGKCLKEELNQLSKCDARYPGMRIAGQVAMSIVNDQRSLLRSNLEWHIVCAAVTVWITRNWDVDQVLAFYSEIDGV